jgi:hypothetical protein
MLDLFLDRSFGHVRMKMSLFFTTGFVWYEPSSKAKHDEAWISDIRIEFSIPHEALRVKGLGLRIDGFVA